MAWNLSGNIKGEQGDVGPEGPEGAAGNVKFYIGMWSYIGVLATFVGTLRFPILFSCTIVRVRIMVGTAPTGASIIVDVNKNGTTIYTTQGNRPTIAIGANDSGAGSTPNVTALVAGDYLTIDIDQIGSTILGSDLTVVMEGTVP